MKSLRRNAVMLTISMLLLTCSFICIVVIVWTCSTYQKNLDMLSEELSVATAKRDELYFTLEATKRQASSVVSEVEAVGSEIALLQNEWRTISGPVDYSRYAQLVTGESLSEGPLWSLYYTEGIDCNWVFSSVFPVDVKEVPMLWLLLDSKGLPMGYATGVYLVEYGMVDDIQHGEFRIELLLNSLENYNSPAGN